MAGGLELAKVFVSVGARTGAKYEQDMRGIQDRVRGSAMGMARVATGAMGALLGGAGLYGMVRLGQESVALWQRQEQAVKRLDAALRATGGAAGYSTGELEAMALELQAATTTGDEAILESMAKLATFKSVQGDVFRRATEAALDLSATGFGSMEQSILQLGKALEDPIRGMGALRRSGVSFTEAEKEQIKTLQESGQLKEAQAIVLAAVEGQVKGVAKAVAGTDTGRMEQLGNLLGDVKERLGKAVLPLFNKFRELQLYVMNKLVSFVEWLGFMAENWKLVWTMMKQSAAVSISKVWDFFYNLWDNLPQLAMASFKTMWEGMKVWYELMISRVMALVEIFKISFSTLKNVWDAFWSGDSMSAAISEGMSKISDVLIQEAAETAAGMARVANTWAEQTAGIDLFKESEATQQLQKELDQTAQQLAQAKADRDAKKLEEDGKKIGAAAGDEIKKAGGLKQGFYDIASFGAEMQKMLLGDDKQAQLVDLAGQSLNVQKEMLENERNKETPVVGLT